MAEKETFRFTLQGSWSGGRLGVGTVATGGLTAQVSIPAEMGGPGVGTNPDELLLAAAANCYLITLASVLDNRRLPVRRLTLASEGEVEREGGRLTYRRIVHRPLIELDGELSEEARETALLGAERAEKACMISQAVRGNVEVAVEAKVLGFPTTA
jgi:peroxiredoxin-like protein